MESAAAPLPFQEGWRTSFQRTVTLADIDAFAALSGDMNPLHMDAESARAAGFRDRVVHGAFLSGLVSRAIGMELPTPHTMLLNMNLHFTAPTYPGDALDITAVVDGVHPAARAVTLKIRVLCAGETRARGGAMVRVGFEE